MIALFLLRCQNSFRQEISLICGAIKHQFMEANIALFICKGPQKWLQYPPDTIQSMYIENNPY